MFFVYLLRFFRVYIVAYFLVNVKSFMYKQYKLYSYPQILQSYPQVILFFSGFQETCITPQTHFLVIKTIDLELNSLIVFIYYIRVIYYYFLCSKLTLFCVWAGSVYTRKDYTPLRWGRRGWPYLDNEVSVQVKCVYLWSTH